MKKKRIVIALVITGTGVLTVLLWQGLESSRHSTRQTLCVHNLKLLYSCLKAYAEEHEGHYPDRLANLLTRHGDNPEFLEILICPEIQAIYKHNTGEKHPFPGHPDADTLERLCSYAYVPGYTVDDPPDAIIFYEKKDNHFGKGRSLMYLDGHGAWEPPENWRHGPPNKTLPPEFSGPQPRE
ncbi:MAG: hypothetical protein BWY09_00063 [Candidatus Hydrogenedentes bacterium ADurb.Bin179]|nr:MAG: hypothetical protein BWY09_00063 [Candidatus Hydrogenedentes bacterium ADurb.Bin179]